MPTTMLETHWDISGKRSGKCPKKQICSEKSPNNHYGIDGPSYSRECLKSHVSQLEVSETEASTSEESIESILLRW